MSSFTGKTFVPGTPDSQVTTDSDTEELQQIFQPLPLVRQRCVRPQYEYSPEELAACTGKEREFKESCCGSHMGYAQELGFGKILNFHARMSEPQSRSEQYPLTPRRVRPVTAHLPVVEPLQRPPRPSPQSQELRRLREENARILQEDLLVREENKKLKENAVIAEKQHLELQKYMKNVSRQRDAFYDKLLSMGIFNDNSVQDLLEMASPEEVTTRNLQKENRDLRKERNELRTLADELVTELDNTRKRKIPDFTVETRVTIDLTDEKEETKEEIRNGKRACYEL